MKHIDQQPGLSNLSRNWLFHEGVLEKIPEDRHEAVRGLYGKANMFWGPTAPEYDDADWQVVQLPHDSVVTHEFTESTYAGAFHGGKKRETVWYRKHFSLPEETRGKQLLIEFEGVTQRADIFVNGILMKHHYSSYHGFTIDITEIAHFGDQDNVIAVEIDPSEHEGWWYEGCGIYRKVWLIQKNRLHIAEDGLFVRPVYDADTDRWTTEIDIEVENTAYYAQRGELHIYLYDPEGREVADTERKVVVNSFETETDSVQLFPEEIRLWDPDHPVLYRCTAELHGEDGLADYRRAYYGYRTIRFDADTGFWINGKNEKIKGFCIHQDHAGIGVAVPYAIKEYRLQLLKDLGANAVRTAHHTDPDIQEIADRLGLMVMEENRSFRTNEETFSNLQQMGRKARNHPSVILYSLFNEELLQGDEQGARMVKRLCHVLSEVDNTRPFTAAMHYGFLHPEGAAPELDVIGINYNTKSYDAVHEKFPQYPIIGSETVSALAMRGTYRDDPDEHLVSDVDTVCTDWGNTARDGWKQVAERPFISGTFVWTGLDYRGEPVPYTWPTIASNFGTLDSCGFMKNSAWLYKAFWTKETFVHLLPDPDLPIDEGTPTLFQVFSNCEEAEIFINGESFGKKPVDAYDMVQWEIPYSLGTFRAVGFRAGEAVCEEEQHTPGSVAAIRITPSKETLQYDLEDAIAINVEAVDAFGHFVPSADTLIFLETEGGGEIIGTDNGDPNSHEPDGLHYRHLFHGRCQAILRNTDGDDVVVRAYAEHIEGDEIRIKTVEAECSPTL